MRRTFLFCVVAVAVLAAGSASHAFPTSPVGATAAAAPTRHPDAPPHSSEKPHRAPDSARREHRVEITVDGPQDTLMRVARGRAGSQVALGGRPFEHAFTEPPGSTGYLDITVAAASRTPSATKAKPVTCELRLDGVTLTRRSATEPGADGIVQVLCRIPESV